jgi:hypothetical protein
MSYGHADSLAHGGREPSDQHPAAQQLSDTTKADWPGDLAPDWYATPNLVPVLTGHDIGGLYRWLNAAGVAQRRIATLTGTSQPQVADIITGRRVRVQVYDVLVRTAEGLKVPRERMGLSFWGPDGRWYGPPDAYPGGVAVAHTPEGVSPAMLRRHLIALGGLIMAGVPIDKAAELKVGKLLDDLGELPPMSLPSRLSSADVTRVRDITRRLAEAGNGCICDGQTLSDAAARVTQLLTVPGPDPVQRALKVAVAELRLEAGWAALDAGLYRHALYHFARALELATDAKDAYCQATALHCAGAASVEHGHPDDGLKMLQAAQVAAWGIPRDDERAVIVGPPGRAASEAAVLGTTSTALALLGDPSTASTCLAKGRELWTPAPTDTYGDLDRPAARLALTRGRLDLAEQLATASVRRWQGGSLISRTQTGIVLATVHVTAGEPRGLQLAHDAITAVARLRSVRVRTQLRPLVDALEARPSTDAKELARMARQAAA